METGIKSGTTMLRQYGAALLAKIVLVVRTPSIETQFMLRYIESLEKSVKNEAWALVYSNVNNLMSQNLNLIYSLLLAICINHGC